MTKIPLSARLLTLLLAAIFLAGSCLAAPPGDLGGQGGSPQVQTIHPATLTAISQMRAADQTPEPFPLGIPWTDLEGLELDFWYIWDLDEPGAGMNAIVDRFNQENPWGITVNPVDQGLVLDPIGSVETAFEEGLIPDLMLSESGPAADWYGQGLLIDLDPLLADPAAGMPLDDQKAFYPGIWENLSYTGQDFPAIPFSQSIQGIYYNDSWGRELGFNQPPQSWADFLDQSCALTESGEQAGAVLAPQIGNILSLIYAYGGRIYQPGEEGYRFTGPEVLALAQDLQDFFRKGCGSLIADYPNPMAVELEFDLFNSRGALMMMGPAQLMDHVHTGPNQSGRADEWSLLPFWGPGGNKAIAADTQAVMIFKTTPQEELASWLFLKYLVSPEVQAEWAQYSKYYPTRKDSLYYLRDFRGENPHWAEGLNLLKYAHSGPFHPTWGVIQLAVEDAFEEVMTNPDLDPGSQLETLSQVGEELWDRLEN